MAIRCRLAVALTPVLGTAIVWLTMVPLAGAADARWIRVRSNNFLVSSEAGEKNARSTLRYFDLAHGLIARVLPDRTGRSEPIHIVQFNSKKEYQLYRPVESAIAHSHRSGDLNYVVLSGTGPEVLSAGIQACVELEISRAGLKLPPWLTEGLANLYSTLKLNGDQATVGILPAVDPNRGAMPGWLPLANLLDPPPQRKAIDARRKIEARTDAGAAESWVLVHMLVFGDGYKGKFPELLDRIAAGGSGGDEMEAVYGKPLVAIDRDLRLYMRNGHFQGVSLPDSSSPRIIEAVAQPESEFDAKLTLIDLIAGSGDVERKQRLEQLSMEDPKRPEPQVSLGLLEMTDRPADARAHFEKAFALGSRDPKMLWSYGQMLAPLNPGEATRVLTILSGQEPERTDVRLTLAAAQFDGKQFSAALATLAPLKTLARVDQPRFFKISAFAQAATGNRAEAAQAAERWAAVAETPQDRDDVDRFLAYLDELRPGEKPRMEFADDIPPGAGDAARKRPDADARQSSPDTRAAEPEESAKPESSAAEAQPPAVPPGTTAPRSSVSGVFVALDCSGGSATVLLLTATGTRTFLIDDPERIRISGERGVTLDLPCGVQKSSDATVEFDPAGPAHPGVDGLVRSIQIRPR